MKYRQKLVPEALIKKNTSGYGNWKRYITIHETDNTNYGADADAHARLQYNGNARAASWHWTVDDKEAVQSFDHGVRCWAAGSTKGNTESIHVEICVNRDGDRQKALENAAALVAFIMERTGIKITNVVQHNYWSGKNCPRNLRLGQPKNWNTFLLMCERAAGIAKPKEPQKDRTQYVVKTNGWKDREPAENAAEIMKLRYGWKPEVVFYDGVYLVKAGIWTSEEFANEAIRKITSAKLAASAYKAKL